MSIEKATLTQHKRINNLYIDEAGMVEFIAIAGLLQQDIG